MSLKTSPPGPAPPDLRNDPRFYWPSINTIPEGMAQVLEQYSNIPRSQQVEHVLRLRNQAYDSKPYPCLGRFRFLELDLASFPPYKSEVLPMMTRPESDKEPAPILLDLGTCLGQDLRKLVFDGVSPSRIYGADIVQEFIDTGYQLFQDEQKLSKDHFICPADIFDNSPDNKLSQLDDKVNVLHITAVFHLFNLEKQKAVARRCLKLLRKNDGRVLILGGQVGNINPGEYARQSGQERFRHNKESWSKMWNEICNEPEWRDRVKGLETKSMLEERPMGPERTLDKPKVIGSMEEGFRWHVWHVWVEFR